MRDPAPDEIVVRAAAPGDAPAIRALLHRAALPDAGVPDDGRGFVVALHGDRLVGVAGVDAAGAEGLLRSVAVAPDRRDLGIGRAVVRAALAGAAAHGVRRVHLLTLHAAPFFTRLGFAPTAFAAIPEALHGCPGWHGTACSGATAMSLG